jgi:hypothetical protein
LARSNSDMDKIMNLFLYIFPKYLDKVNEQKNDRNVVKKIHLEKSANKPVFKKIEKKENKDGRSKGESLKNDYKLEDNQKGKLTKKSDTTNISNEDDRKIDKENKFIKHGGENSDYIKEENYQKDIYKDNTKNNESLKEQKSKNEKKNNILKNEVCSICDNGMENILKKLIGEKVDISITDSTMFLLNTVTILSVEDAIVKLKTTLNANIIIPIQEVVGIKCNSIYGINFEDNYDSDVCIEYCKREENMRRYFASIIGKKIFLQTKGAGEFKYINNRIITGTGRGVVIIEGTMAISLSKIILIEEMV